MKDLIHIIGCGSTGAHWPGEGPSIGVNDCWKFGKPTDALLVLNDKKAFTPERLETILNSKPKVFYTHLREWQNPFKHEINRITTKKFYKIVEPGIIYHSKTSPIAAISLASVMGYKQIILWGVDFVDHKYFRPGQPMYNNEKLMYELFCKSIKGQYGAEVFLGVRGSTLNLPIFRSF